MKFFSRIFYKLNKNSYDLFFIAISLLLGLYLNWPIIYIGVLVFTIWMILKPIKNEILITAALIIVVLIPISQAAKDSALTESLGIVVYVLIIAIFFQLIIETSSNEKKQRDKKSKPV